MKSTLVEPKHVSEQIPLRFPFASEIAPGVTIAAVARTFTVKRGTDTNAQQMLIGDPIVAACTGEVFQVVAAGVAGATYRTVMQATLSNGLVLVRACDLPVIDFY